VPRFALGSIQRQPLSALLALAIAGLGSFGLRELAASNAATAPPPLNPCEDARVGLVWPLGLHGYEPRKLYSTHDQFQHFPPDDPMVHQGMDIGGCKDDWVYAAAPGKVVLVYPAGTYSAIIVSDGDDLARGYKYQHLYDYQFGEKEEVHRDDALGKLVQFTDFTGFEHVHFQVVKAVCDHGAKSCDEWKNEVDLDNPLPLFPARMDAARPVVHDLGPDHSLPGPFLFYADGDTTTPLDPAALEGSVDVVACVIEGFPGTVVPACSSGAGCASGFSTDVAPYRLTVCVLEAQSTSDPRKPQRVLYHNSIRLDGPALDGALPEYYRDDGVGDYVTDRPLFVMTHCAAAGGAWDTSSGLTGNPPCALQVELVVEDTSGNVAVETMDVTVIHTP
jgi:murein DD-endopeptidase MepM/ murein hydrolase activator NlpD